MNLSVSSAARGTADGASSVALLPDGRMVIAGGDGNDFAVAQLAARMGVVSSRFNFDLPAHQVAIQLADLATTDFSFASFDLVNLTTGTPVAATSIQGQFTPDNAHIQLAFPGFTRGTLPDGNYRLTVLADKVHDSSGQSLDGNNDGAAHDDAIEDLYRLFGDTDGDRDVDNTDFYYVRSTDNGLTWSPPLRLDGDGGTRGQWQPSLAVTPAGHVFVSWYDQRNTSGDDLQRFGDRGQNIPGRFG